MDKLPSDKELEEFYKAKFESHPFPFQEEAWEEMDKLLDQQRRRRFILVFLFWLLASGSAFFLWTHHSAKTIDDLFNDDEASYTLTKESSLSDQEMSREVINVNGFDQDNILATKSLADVSEDLIDQSQISSAHSEVTNQDKYVSVHPSVNAKNAKTSLSTARVDDFNISASRFDESVDTQVMGGQTDLYTEEYQIDEVSYIDHGRQLNPVLSYDVYDIRSLKSIEPVEMKPLVVSLENPTAPEMVETEDLEDIKIFPFRFGVGLSSSSTWTAHGEYSKIDIGAHLHASYFLNDLLAVNIDASYVNDIYRAERDDYKADASFWKALGQPEYITADCKMIGLNVGLEYYLKGRDQNGLSLRASSTSNFMLNESYSYHYANTEDNFSSSWTMSDNQWFNGLGLKVSYQWVLNKDIVFQLGGFYETPFSGIGHGDIMLSKVGLQMNISF